MDIAGKVFIVTGAASGLGEGAARMLAREGAIVTVAVSASEALDRLRESPEGWHIVLMDVQMPGMDGNEATRRLRAGLGLTDLPVIALSAGALLAEKQRALAAGMDDFLVKPLDPETLTLTVRRHADYDHGYYFVQSMVADHLTHHARSLKTA